MAYKRLHKRCETVIKHGGAMRNLCKGPYAICEHRRPGPIKTFAQYDQDLLCFSCILLYPVIFKRTDKTVICLRECRLIWDSPFVNYITTLFLPHRVPLMTSLRV